MSEENTLKIEKEIEIKNELGLHARPAAMFVQAANRFNAKVHVMKDGETINGKSIMGVMMLAAAKGTKIKVIAEGEDAQKAIDELGQLFINKFGEE
ncbi:MAG: HPr family phosphocarrier protein [Candidatus Aureabacteria bacterium]|nr:HPr family phosphocarrier protein [Candidatus Auribacterota bacterium]MCK5161213.1 HPr family phosphocarrier protein [Candidatus Auribacterota bacterium]MCK5655681.1 HPr family phosphocarrier protein [Candidatus Auribacterota bacterium]